MKAQLGYPQAQLVSPPERVETFTGLMTLLSPTVLEVLVRLAALSPEGVYDSGVIHEILSGKDKPLTLAESQKIIDAALEAGLLNPVPDEAGGGAVRYSVNPQLSPLVTG